VGESIVAKCPAGGIQCRAPDACIFSCEIILTGLSDARYPFIVFREVHWSPFLTPGEPAKELQNAENGGAIGQPVAPTSFLALVQAILPKPWAGGRNVLAGAASRMDCPDGAGNAGKTRKKGGAMNAPPLERV
jgi:hypothetical protein